MIGASQLRIHPINEDGGPCFTGARTDLEPPGFAAAPPFLLPCFTLLGAREPPGIALAIK